jgi:hypothetical protein
MMDKSGLDVYLNCLPEWKPLPYVIQQSRAEIFTFYKNSQVALFKPPRPHAMFSLCRGNSLNIVEMSVTMTWAQTGCQVLLVNLD